MPDNTITNGDMTRTQQALKILRNDKPRSYRDFAKMFWPDSDMFHRVTNCGNGARQGAGAFLCAGSFLAKLERQGLLFKRRYGEGYDQPIAYLTEKGKRLLEANQ